MKTIKIILILVILGFNNTFAQVNTTIESVYANSTTYNNCSLIDFGTTSNNSLTFYYKLTKPTSQAIGNSTLRILLKYNSSSYGSERSNITVLSNGWANNNTEYIGTIACNISESEIQTTGSSIFIEFTTDSGVKTSSCEYPLTKTPPPSFTFSPTSLSLACGDTSSRTFTITPSNIPSGASVTYQWSYSGWTLVSSTTTSRTLQPISGTTLPSNVSVTPYINSVAYPSKTCAVARSSIASSGSISGNATICTTRTYTFTGLLAGQSLNWSLSNSTAGTLSTTSGTPTIFTKTGGGAVTLTATISNTCGQSYTKTLALFVGSPPAFSIVRASNETCDGIKYHYVPFEIPNRNPLITYTFNIASIPGVTVTQTSWTYNGNIQNVLVFPKTYVGPVDFSVSTTNSCGNFSVFAEEEINSCSGLGLRLSNPIQQFTVFPNPANDVVTIQLTDQENKPEKDATISGELFDIIGQSKSKVQISKNKATFSVRELKKGIYVLKIYINDQVENHQIVIE